MEYEAQFPCFPLVSNPICIVVTVGRKIFRLGHAPWRDVRPFVIACLSGRLVQVEDPPESICDSMKQLEAVNPGMPRQAGKKVSRNFAHSAVSRTISFMGYSLVSLMNRIRLSFGELHLGSQTKKTPQDICKNSWKSA